METQIKISLKPIGLAKSIKKDYQLELDPNSTVQQFANRILELEDFKTGLTGSVASDDLNFMSLGKTLNHYESFAHANVKNGAKLILTIKKNKTGAAVK